MAYIFSHSSKNNLTQAITELNDFFNKASGQNLPFDSHCGVAPIQFDSECDDKRVTQISDGARRVKNAKKRFVPHVSPYVSATIFYSSNI